MASNWSSCARACARGGRRVHSSGYPRPSNSITSQCHERCCHHGLFYLFPQSPIEKPQNCRLTDVWRAKVQLSPVRFNLYQSRTWHEIGNIGVGFVGGCKGMLEGKSRKCPGREISIVARSGKNIRAKNKLTFFTLFKGFVLWTCFRSDCEGHCKGGKKKGRTRSEDEPRYPHGQTSSNGLFWISGLHCSSKQVLTVVQFEECREVYNCVVAKEDFRVLSIYTMR